MEIPKTCIYCNIPYIADRNVSRFCSLSCKGSYFNDLKRKEPKKEVNCLICNKSFITWKQGHKFCSPSCAYESQMRSWRAHPRKTERSVLLARESRKQPLSSLQKEIIYGAILGDGCTEKQRNGLHSLRLGHSEKQLPYLLFKVNLLGILFQAKPSKSEKSGFGISPYYRISSISHGDITSNIGFFYRNGKRLITQQTLDILTPTSLLIWYLDDGTNIKRFGSCSIASNRYSLSENRMVSKWLWHKFRIETTIQERKKILLDNPEQFKIYYSIYITKGSTDRFFTLLKQSPIFEAVPECMKYKFLKNK